MAPRELEAVSGESCLAVEDPAHAQLCHHPQHCCHMAMWQRAPDGECGIRGGKHHPAPEPGPDGLDQVRGHLRQIGDDTSADALSFAPGFPQEDGRRGRTVGNDIDAEGHISANYMATIP